MDILPDCERTSIVEDDDPEPSEADRSWWASQTEEWHDLDHDDDQADIDQRAGEAAYLDSHELGLKTF